MFIAIYQFVDGLQFITFAYFMPGQRSDNVQIEINSVYWIQFKIE